MMLLPDFEGAARRFREHGWQAERLGEAIWRYRPRHARPGPRLQLLLTAGVHGDETAPIEMLARRLPGWAEAAATLEIDLFVAIGNLDAVAAGKRYLRHDMNRMFGAAGVPRQWGAESRRAELLQQALAATLRDAGGAACVHLDLHTTIRPSLKPTFAIVPGDDAQSPLVRWLGRAGLHAAVLNPGPNVTLSAFSARLGAAACTVELGKVGSFGANDLGLLADFDAALDALVRAPAQTWGTNAEACALEVYRVTHELVRSSEQFELMVPGSAPNFAQLEPGQLVARDRLDLVYARHPGECVLFPNPSVALGLRAGLLVAPAARALPG